MKPTGNFNRWAASNGKGEIASIEVEVLAEGYESKPTWVNVDKLMWGDKEWEPIQPAELESFCKRVADEKEIASIICKEYDGHNVTYPYCAALVVAASCVEAAYDLGMAPADLLEGIRQNGRLDDLAWGVSVHSILEDMSRSSPLVEAGLKMLEDISEE